MLFPHRIRTVVAAAMVAVCAVFPTEGTAQEVDEPFPWNLRAAAAVPVVHGQGGPGSPSCDPCSLRDTVQRPGALLPLYASLGVLQALDVHSTGRGLAVGGREANPVMQPIVGNRAAFVAVKAATTVGVVWASERLWRKQNRKAAVVLTALTNIGLAAVVAHNYRAAR